MELETEEQVNCMNSEGTSLLMEDDRSGVVSKIVYLLWLWLSIFCSFSTVA